MDEMLVHDSVCVCGYGCIYLMYLCVYGDEWTSHPSVLLFRPFGEKLRLERYYREGYEAEYVHFEYIEE